MNSPRPRHNYCCAQNMHGRNNLEGEGCKYIFVCHEQQHVDTSNAMFERSAGTDHNRNRGWAWRSYTHWQIKIEISDNKTKRALTRANNCQGVLCTCWRAGWSIYNKNLNSFTKPHSTGHLTKHHFFLLKRPNSGYVRLMPTFYTRVERSTKHPHES